MALTDAERTELAGRIQRRRERVFGTKRAAYQEAGVNAATWDKAEQGESVRGDLLRRIVRTLWPESEGDWTAIGVISEQTAADYGTTLERLEQRVLDLEREIRELRPALTHQPEDEDEDSVSSA